MAPPPLDPEAVQYVMERCVPDDPVSAVATLRALPHRRALDDPSPEWLDRFAESVGAPAPPAGPMDERLRAVADAIAVAHGAYDALQLARAVDVMTARGELWETIKLRCRRAAAAAPATWRGDVRDMVRSVTDCAAVAGGKYAYVVERATTSPDPPRYAALALIVCLVGDLYRQLCGGDARRVLQRCLVLAGLPVMPCFGASTMYGMLMDACPPDRVAFVRGYDVDKRALCVLALLMVQELNTQLLGGARSEQCASDLAWRVLLSGA